MWWESEEKIAKELNISQEIITDISNETGCGEGLILRVLKNAISEKILFTKENLNQVLNMGMNLREEQLGGETDKSGKELLEEYIANLNKEPEEEKTIPITYGLIKNTFGWSRFCDVTNRNHYAIREFGDYDDNELFNITHTEAKKLGVIS